MTWFRLKCCVKCGGDLVLDSGDWLCLQCGTYYYTGLYRRLDSSNCPRPNAPQPPQERTWAGGLGADGLWPRNGMTTNLEGRPALMTSYSVATVSPAIAP